MFNRKRIEDERITAEHRKHNAEGFAIVYWGLLIDVFYRSVIVHQNPAEFWDIAVLFFGVTLFVALRNTSGGVVYFGGKKKILKTILPSALIASITGALTFKWMNPALTGWDLVIDALIFFAGFTAVIYVLYAFSNRRADDFERQ